MGCLGGSARRFKVWARVDILLGRPCWNKDRVSCFDLRAYGDCWMASPVSPMSRAIKTTRPLNLDVNSGEGLCTAELGPGKGAARDEEEVARAVGDGADGDGGGEGQVDAEEVGEDRRDGGSREGGGEGRGQEERGEEHCGDCWGWWKSKFGGVGGKGPATWSTMGGAVGWDINPAWLGAECDWRCRLLCR